MKIAKEADLQSACNKHLRGLGVEPIHIEKGSGRNKTHRKGIPDLLWGYGGHVFALELKMPGGKVSPEQEVWMKRMKIEWGATVGVVYSFAEFIEWLTFNMYGKKLK